MRPGKLRLLMALWLGRIGMVSLFWVWAAGVICAQPVADIRPQLKALTEQQRAELFNYFRHLRVQVADQAQHAYEQLTEPQKRRVIDLLDFYRRSGQEELLARVVWSPDTLVLGDMVEGTVRIDSFRVTNVGEYPYRIESTWATCDCAVVYAPDYPIMPGTSAVLRVEFKSHGKLGQSHPVVVVFDNSEPNKRHILYVKAHISARKKVLFPWDN